jgi:hypothetical protein
MPWPSRMSRTVWTPPSTCTSAPQGPNGDTPVGVWDLNSVMNYRGESVKGQRGGCQRTRSRHLVSTPILDTLPQPTNRLTPILGRGGGGGEGGGGDSQDDPFNGATGGAFEK